MFLGVYQYGLNWRQELTFVIYYDNIFYAMDHRVL